MSRNERERNKNWQANRGHKKDITIKVRIDTETQEMIYFCAEKMNLSKSKIVRLGITKVYKETKGD